MAAFTFIRWGETCAAASLQAVVQNFSETASTAYLDLLSA